MGKEYKQLMTEERSVIAVGLEQGLSRRAIARLLKRPVCTVSREINRNAGTDDSYQPQDAAARCTGRKFRRVKLLSNAPALWLEVQVLMGKGWSPEQVAGKLKRMYPDDPGQHVSHETIYAHIYAYPRGGLRTEMIKLLRKSHKTRRPRARGEDRRGKIQNMTLIADRPKDIDSRAVAGHWEGDLIKGKYNRSSVGTFVERTSRYVILVQLDNAKAETVRGGFVRELQGVPPALLKSITYDQGREMAQHEQLAATLHLAVYFCDPHAPWQRGSNENTNGLLRQYLPKGSDLNAFSQADLNSIAVKLNTRPRKKLGFLTPEEVYFASSPCQTLESNVALQS
jgi:transposase, IS30 family